MVSLVSLIIMVIGGIILINLALKTWVFPKADNYSYYAPRIDCSAVNKDQYMPECSDPDYQAKQEKMEKENRTAQKQSDASQAIAMILVASPVFYYHWRLARKEV